MNFPSYIGSLEYDEWSNHRHAWKLESAAIIEPPTNFIMSSRSKGKKRQHFLCFTRPHSVILLCLHIISMFNMSLSLNSKYYFLKFFIRPRWALIDKAYMHSTWRSSQSSYHLYRVGGNFGPSEHVILLVDDLLNLSLHSYETVRV